MRISTCVHDYGSGLPCVACVCVSSCHSKRASFGWRYFGILTLVEFSSNVDTVACCQIFNKVYPLPLCSLSSRSETNGANQPSDNQMRLTSRAIKFCCQQSSPAMRNLLPHWLRWLAPTPPAWRPAW
ncbi:putative NADH-quinone oxidoreductase subunit I [Trichinella spiralis]|uniref:putative NADH-quinone oxidoreductase subunit I n=1 Tax=Trichinella spiralis TaxID=6334 RepID=UPI0001EFE5E6|nr:putative NADH-quinone oxidoreductase subunit I [Trichinella spiralis]